MNANGIQIFTRAYNAASTAGNPAAIAIQIGKGLKGKSLDLYKSVGKVTSGSVDKVIFRSASAEQGLTFKAYDEVSGILLLDAGNNNESSTTSSGFRFSDGTSNQTSGYLVINASKNPALTGIGALETNYVYVEAAGNAGQVITTGVTNIPFIEIKDTHNAWDGSTFTVPEDGDNNIKTSMLFNADTTRGIHLYIDGVDTRRMSFQTPGVSAAIQAEYTGHFNQGAAVSLRVVGGTTHTLSNNASLHYLTITKIPGKF
jgi:hypothetical protein